MKYLYLITLHSQKICQKYVFYFLGFELLDCCSTEKKSEKISLPSQRFEKSHKKKAKEVQIAINTTSSKYIVR